MAATDKIGQTLMYIVRHGLVDLDVEGKIRGTQNEPLNEEGEKQTQELADYFRSRPISAVYSDDLKRTYHTAIAIAHAADLEVTQDIALRSWDVGSDLEGLSIEANEDEIKELKLQPDKIPVGGQSWRDFEQQTRQAFEKYVSMALDASAPLVLVLHGSGVQVIWDAIGAADKNATYDETPLEPSGVAVLFATRSGYGVRVVRGAVELADA